MYESNREGKNKIEQKVAYFLDLEIDVLGEFLGPEIDRNCLGTDNTLVNNCAFNEIK